MDSVPCVVTPRRLMQSVHWHNLVIQPLRPLHGCSLDIRLRVERITSTSLSTRRLQFSPSSPSPAERQRGGSICGRDCYVLTVKLQLPSTYTVGCWWRNGTERREKRKKASDKNSRPPISPISLPGEKKENRMAIAHIIATLSVGLPHVGREQQ